MVEDNDESRGAGPRRFPWLILGVPGFIASAVVLASLMSSFYPERPSPGLPPWVTHRNWVWSMSEAAQPGEPDGPLLVLRSGLKVASLKDRVYTLLWRCDLVNCSNEVLRTFASYRLLTEDDQVIQVSSTRRPLPALAWSRLSGEFNLSEDQLKRVGRQSLRLIGPTDRIDPEGDCLELALAILKKDPPWWLDDYLSWASSQGRRLDQATRSLVTAFGYRPRD